jgi:hypothetical protein
MNWKGFKRKQPWSNQGTISAFCLQVLRKAMTSFSHDSWYPSTHLLYIICNKCICSISICSWMSYAQWRNSYTFFFVHLDIILILVLGFYSGLSGRVRTVYLFSLCVVLLLCSRFTASALVWFPNFLKYLVFHFFTSLSTVSFLDLHGSCDSLSTKVHSEWIGESWIENAGECRCWNWRLSPTAEFHRSIWV